jgi:lipid II:glycine glycyltransferase (peptidoglycan interpeptide bridge formation enzyme)
MNLVEITDRVRWDAFQAAQPWSQFPQSWDWGEFRRENGFEVRRFGLFDETGTLLVGAQMEFRPKRVVGGYWFAPRGPVFSERLDIVRRPEVFRAFMDALLRMRLHRSLFWRFEPAMELNEPEGLIPLAFLRNAPQNPSSTVVLDLAPSQDEMLQAMHPKTRYNIRIADRHGVTTRIATRPDDELTFLDLMERTAERDGFVQRPREYLRATFTFLRHRGMARIRLAEHQKKPLAANLEILCGDTVTYLYGASSDEARNLMAPYALHWDAIMQAKRDGMRFYDFWGANPPSKAMPAYKASWEGITRFKRGWGGRQVDLFGTWDLPFIRPLYHLVFRKQAWRS